MGNSTGSSQQGLMLGALVIAASVLLVFLPVALHLDFSSLDWQWARDFGQMDFGTLLAQTFTSPQQTAHYQPLFLLTQRIIKGCCEATRPGICHGLLVMLHLGAALAIFFYLGLLFSNRALALSCALLFALHPMNDHNVWWSVNLAQPVVVILFLASLHQFQISLRQASKGSRRLAMATTLFVVALLFYEQTYGLALVYPVVACLELRRQRIGWGRPLLRSLPFILAMAAVALLRLVIVRGVKYPAESSLPLVLQQAARNTFAIFYQLVLEVIPGNLFRAVRMGNFTLQRDRVIAWHRLELTDLAVVAFLAILTIWAIRRISANNAGLQPKNVDLPHVVLLAITVLIAGYATVLPKSGFFAWRHNYIPAIGWCILLCAFFHRAGLSFRKRWPAIAMLGTSSLGLILALFAAELLASGRATWIPQADLVRYLRTALPAYSGSIPPNGVVFLEGLEWTAGSTAWIGDYSDSTAMLQLLLGRVDLSAALITYVDGASLFWDGAHVVYRVPGRPDIEVEPGRAVYLRWHEGIIQQLDPLILPDPAGAPCRLLSSGCEPLTSEAFEQLVANSGALAVPAQVYFASERPLRLENSIDISTSDGLTLQGWQAYFASIGYGGQFHLALSWKGHPDPNRRFYAEVVGYDLQPGGVPGDPVVRIRVALRNSVISQTASTYGLAKNMTAIPPCYDMTTELGFRLKILEQVGHDQDGSYEVPLRAQAGTYGLQNEDATYHLGGVWLAVPDGHSLTGVGMTPVSGTGR